MKNIAVIIILCFTLFATISCSDDETLTKINSEYFVFHSEGVVLNPSGYAPLAAGIPVTTSEKLDVVITVKSAYEAQDDLLAEFSIFPSNDLQWIPVLGLYPDYMNEIAVSISLSEGEELVNGIYKLKTKPVFNELPDHAEIEGQYPEADEMVFAGCSLRGLFNLQQAVAFDRYGNVRWYSQFPYGYHPIEIINGKITAGEHTYKNRLHSINLLGFTEKEVQFGTGENGYNYIHHDLVDIGDDHFLLTVNDDNSDERENVLIEVDFKTGEVVKKWNLENILPNVDDLYADTPNTYYKKQDGRVVRDTLHINAVDFNPESREILITSQRFGVALMSYEGELLWIMAPHNLRRKNIDPNYDPLALSSRKDNLNIPAWPPTEFLAVFDENNPETWRMPVSGRIPDYVKSGEKWNYDMFLLDPVIPALNRDLPEKLLESGQDIAAGGKTFFAWSFRPHSAKFLDNGDIVVFDNGFSRNFVPFVTEDSYSRAVIYHVERGAGGYGGRVSQVWDYRLTEGWEGFSLFLGETEELENGNILIDFGGLGKAENVLKYFNPSVDPSILISDLEGYLEKVPENVVIVEVEALPDGRSNEVFKLSYPANEKGTTGSYRASKFNLYQAWL